MVTPFRVSLRLPLAAAALLLAALLAGASLLAGCALTGVNRGDLNTVSLEQEWHMGQQLAHDLRGELRLVEGGAVEDYVARMGQRIASTTPLARQPWTFHVVDDDAINAFNIPGGHVYVNTGLVTAAGSASELAGVVAHEVAHGVSRHGTEQLTKQQGLGVAAGVLLGSNPSGLERLAAQVAAGGAAAKFSRDDEREADALAVRYMYDAGYDPRGLASMFEKLLAEGERRPSAVSRFFSTHPLTTERIADARRRASGLPAQRGHLGAEERTFAAVRRTATRY